ncbi:hypothetical protein Tco_1352559 [Tanacetum coccineum]
MLILLVNPLAKKLNVVHLIHPGNGMIGCFGGIYSSKYERFANTAYGFFLGKKVAYPVVANYVLSAIATKLGTPLMLDSYTSDMCMQSWGRSSYARVMIELRADVELKDNIVMAILKLLRRAIYTCNVRDEYEWKLLGAGEKKTMKKPSQTFRGVSVGSKIGKLRLLDNDGNSLVPTGIVESDSEVEVVFDETANLRISTSGKDGSDKGYGTNSLLEQWRDSYPDNDDYDPYDDDMYENHDLSEHLQSICDDLDITHRKVLVLPDCSPVSTPMDPVEKLKPYTGKPVDQLEYSGAIGFLMYAMTSTRPDIAYAAGRLNKFTSNPSRQYWQAITRVFLLGGGSISWASKKQTCINGSTMEYEFVALVAAGKEA